MNKVVFQIKTALSNLKRNLTMTLSSALAVMVTLTLVMFFVAVAMNINSVSDQVDKSVEIFAQIDKVAKEKDYSKIEEKIKAIDHVTKVKFSSKEEQKKKFLESNGGKDYKEILDENNPLSPAYYVEVSEGKYIKSVSQQIGKIKGISDTEYGGQSAEMMLKSFNQMKIWGGVVVLGLCFLALFLISNTIGITINARKNEIAIMRNVGATNWYIRVPFMIEGMIIGLIGAIIPILVAVFGYNVFYDMMNGVFFSDLFPMVKPDNFGTMMIFFLSGLGIIVGIVGSLFSVTRNLKWKR